MRHSKNVKSELKVPQSGNIDPADALQVNYHAINSEEKWRIPLIQDIIETKNGQVDMMNIYESDLEDMLDVLCTS